MSASLTWLLKIIDLASAARATFLRISQAAVSVPAASVSAAVPMLAPACFISIGLTFSDTSMLEWYPKSGKCQLRMAGIPFQRNGS